MSQRYGSEARPRGRGGGRFQTPRQHTDRPLRVRAINASIDPLKQRFGLAERLRSATSTPSLLDRYHQRDLVVMAREERARHTSVLLEVSQCLPVTGPRVRASSSRRRMFHCFSTEPSKTSWSPFHSTAME